MDMVSERYPVTIIIAVYQIDTNITIACGSDVAFLIYLSFLYGLYIGVLLVFR